MNITRRRSAPTLRREGNEIMIVSMSFYIPLSYFTSLRIRVILNTLMIRMSWGPKLRIDSELPPTNPTMRSTILEQTIKQSNWFHPESRYPLGVRAIILRIDSNMNVNVNTRLIVSKTV